MTTDRLISAHTPSSWDGDPAVMRMNPMIVNTGWPNWVEAKVIPDVMWGVRRVLLHMPFGRGTGAYYIDTWQQCESLGLKNVTSSRGFKAAFRPLMDEGVEVIAYVGQVKKCARLERLKRARYVDNWLNAIIDAIRLPLDNGMSIAIDASSSVERTDPEYLLMELLRQMGVRVYVETASNSPQLLPYPQIITDSFYRDMIKQPWMPTKEQIPELVRWPAAPPSGAWTHQWVHDVTHEIQADGHTACVSVEWLRGKWERKEFN